MCSLELELRPLPLTGRTDSNKNNPKDKKLCLSGRLLKSEFNRKIFFKPHRWMQIFSKTKITRKDGSAFKFIDLITVKWSLNFVFSHMGMSRATEMCSYMFQATFWLYLLIGCSIFNAIQGRGFILLIHYMHLVLRKNIFFHSNSLHCRYNTQYDPFFLY